MHLLKLIPCKHLLPPERQVLAHKQRIAEGIRKIDTRILAGNYATNPYVDRSEISASAIELFQKDCDINKFNKIAMSDEGDFSHLERMQELFSQGVIDVFEDDVLNALSTNSKLWDDLEL